MWLFSPPSHTSPDRRLNISGEYRARSLVNTAWDTPGRGTSAREDSDRRRFGRPTFGIAGDIGGLEKLDDVDVREKDGVGDARPTVREPLVDSDDELLDGVDPASFGGTADAVAWAESSMVSTNFVCRECARLDLFVIHLRDLNTTECPARAVTRGIRPALGNSVR